MGYMRHHAILVTSWNRRALEMSHDQAMTIGLCVSDIVPGICNGEDSFFVAPDGSKEGWAESDAGDARRDAFVEYLNGTQYDDGSSALAWVEVQYGDDNRDTRIIRHSDERPLIV